MIISLLQNNLPINISKFVVTNAIMMEPIHLLVIEIRHSSASGNPHRLLKTLIENNAPEENKPVKLEPKLMK